MTNYRKIWKDAKGPIPKDTFGRSYEIHHINGDHWDNRLENLQCVSIDEHYQIHLSQGDYQAAAAIAKRIRISPEKQKQLDHLAGKQAYKLKKGFHAFSPEEKAIHSRKGAQSNRGKLWWNDGTSNRRSPTCPGEGWINGKIPCGSGPKVGSKIGVFWNNGCANVRSEESPGPDWVRGRFLNDEQRKRRSEIAARRVVTQTHKDSITHKLKGRTQAKVQCPHCNRSGGAGPMSRFHFDNCKNRS